MSFKSLQELKKTRGNFDALSKALESQNTFQTKENDDRFWQPTVDKSGNGFAIIRFLPEPKGEDLAWVRIFTHGFKGPTGKWYIENSLSTIGQTDPIAEYNKELWDTGIEENQQIVRTQKRKLNYYCNILVVSDPGNRENEGKVMLFKFGKKIFDKIKDLMNPQFPDETPINPFDFWEGANFKLKICTVDKYRNFDKSEFDKPSPIADSDEEIEKIWNSQYSLQAFLDPSNFKSYEELQKSLDRALNRNGNSNANKPKQNKPKPQSVEEEGEEDIVMEEKVTSKKTPVIQDNEEDDDISYFQNLAK